MNTRKVLFKRNSLIFQDVVDAYKIHVHKNTIHTLKTLFKSHLLIIQDIKYVFGTSGGI